MAQPVRALVEGVDEFIGIDHHKKRCQVMVKDRQGKVLRRGNIPTRREALETFLGERNAAVRMAVFEAGPRYRPLYRWLVGLADEVVMANPGRLKIISETAYKDDEIDAEKLADFGMLGMVPEAYVCGDEAWDRQQRLRQRAAVVKMQTSVKNHVHALDDLRCGVDFTELGQAGGITPDRAEHLVPAQRQRLAQLVTQHAAGPENH